MMVSLYKTRSKELINDKKNDSGSHTHSVSHETTNVFGVYYHAAETRTTTANFGWTNTTRRRYGTLLQLVPCLLSGLLSAMNYTVGNTTQINCKSYRDARHAVGPSTYPLDNVLASHPCRALAASIVIRQECFGVLLGQTVYGREGPCMPAGLSFVLTHH